MATTEADWNAAWADPEGAAPSVERTEESDSEEARGVAEGEEELLLATPGAAAAPRTRLENKWLKANPLIPKGQKRRAAENARSLLSEPEQPLPKAQRIRSGEKPGRPRATPSDRTRRLRREPGPPQELVSSALPEDRCNHCVNCKRKDSLKQGCIRGMARYGNVGAGLTLLGPYSVGIFVGVYWPTDGKHYAAEVMSYDAESMKHEVKYFIDHKKEFIALYKREHQVRVLERLPGPPARPGQPRPTRQVAAAPCEAARQSSSIEQSDAESMDEGTDGEEEPPLPGPLVSLRMTTLFSRCAVRWRLRSAARRSTLRASPWRSGKSFAGTRGRQLPPQLQSGLM